MQAIEFPTKTGQMCDDWRQEYMLLSDILGVSMLVDAINSRRPVGASENTALGPFHIGGTLNTKWELTIASMVKAKTLVFGKPDIKHHGQADNLGTGFEVLEGGRFGHSQTLRNHPARLKTSSSDMTV